MTRISPNLFFPVATLVLVGLLGCPPASDPSTPGPADGDDPADIDDDDDATAVDDDDATSDDDDAWPGDDDDSTTTDDDDVAGDDDDAAWDDDDDDDDEEDVEACDEAFEAPQTKFLSADDSNSMADPAHQRHLLVAHDQVQPVSKAWEYLNYYEFDYEPAESGHLRIEPQLVERDDEPGAYDMLVAVVAPHVPTDDRAPLNLVFSVDTSGSMSGAAIAMVEASLTAIANGLQGGDVVSMVTWSTTNSVVLDSHSILGAGDPTLLAAIDDLSVGGGTNLEAGLEAAYDLAWANYSPTRTNRVILLSDGGANVGVTSAAMIATHATDGETEGIYLAGIGTPPPLAYNDTLMDTVTDLGKGAYLYIDSATEAEDRLNAEHLPELFQVAARDVQLAVTLPPGFVVDDFTGEEIGNTPSEVVPQHLAPNAQMLYDLDLLDCTPAGDSESMEFQFTVEWVDPITGVAMVDVVTMSVAEMLAAPHLQLDKSAAIVAYAEAHEALVGIGGAAAKGEFLEALLEDVSATAAAFPADADLAEIVSLTAQWRSLYP